MLPLHVQKELFIQTFFKFERFLEFFVVDKCRTEVILCRAEDRCPSPIQLVKNLESRNIKKERSQLRIEPGSGSTPEFLMPQGARAGYQVPVPLAKR